VGAEVFEQVWLHFDSIRNAGFEMDQILFSDVSNFINRDGYSSQDEMEEYAWEEGVATEQVGEEGAMEMDDSEHERGSEGGS
jgi:hypothetical protein